VTASTQRLLRDGAGLGLETLEAILAIKALPPSKSGHADGRARRVGNIIVAAGHLLAQGLLATSWILTPDEREDECVAKERDLGASIFGLGHRLSSWG